MRTVRLWLGLLVAAAALVLVAAALVAPLMPYLVVCFFLACIFYSVIKGR